MFLQCFVIVLAILTVYGREVRDDDLITVNVGNSKVSVHLHGATIISWTVDGKEQLFLSGAAKLDGSTHIMGGVPIVFPKFADWGPDRPFHGFARTSRWNFTKVEDGIAEFKLEDSELTRSFWNHTFRLTYTVELRPTELKSTLAIHNPSDTCFSFEVLYHTFIRVPNVRNITISGLKDLKYRDKLRNMEEFTETRDLVRIENFTDSVYLNTPDVILTDVVGGKNMELTKSNLPDLVVWNPWSEAIKNFTDLLPNEWVDYVCAEAGHVASQETLPPGGVYQAIQTLRIF